MKDLLRKSITEQFGKIIEVLQDGYILADREGNIIDVNPAYCDIIGYDKEELLQMNLGQVRSNTDEDYQREFFDRVVKDESAEFEIQHITKSGKKADFLGSATATEIEEEVYLAEFLRDVTKRKEQQLNSLFDHNPLPVYLFDPEGRFIKLNDRLVEFTGHSRKELKEMNFGDFIHEDDLERTQKHFQKALSGEAGQYEIRVIVKGDKEKEIRVTKFPMYEDGEVAGVYGILEDITQQKKAERKLEDTKNRLQSLFKNNPHPVYYFDLKGNFMGANKRTEEVSGYSEDELLSMNFAPIIVEEDLERTQQHFESAASGSVEIYEIKIQAKQGDIKDLRVTNFPMRDGDNIVGVFGIAEDITEAKFAKEKLKESEKRWQHLVEGNPQPVQVTVDGNIVFINKAGAKLYGAESPEEIVGISVFEFSHPSYVEKIAERKHKLENNLDVDTVHEHNIVRLDGELRFVEVHSIPIDYKGEKAIQTVIHDVTERKKQEQIVKQSLEEKEVLLKEIHHRVKNNMAVVSGLLQLQAMSSEDEKLTEMLEESQLRIYSMAMIHEKLYQTETLSEINVEKYIKELVGTIKDTVVEDDTRVKISYNIDDLILDINRAIPCALILNELVVNCFKHAFSEIDDAQIKITLLEKDGQIRVKVRDNGKGLPDDFDINNLQTLGMSLIRTLTAQLEGEVGHSKNENGSGTEFFVEFPINN